MVKNLNYELTGDSLTTIVFLHGWGLNKDSFNNIITMLDSNQRVLKLDFFSFGNSDDPEKYFDTYEYAYYVFLLLKKLDIKKIILVGHSFGGRVSLILSSIFKIDIVGMILTSSAGVNFFNIKKHLNVLRYKICKFLVNYKLLNKTYLLKFGSSDYKNLNNNCKQVFINIVNQDLRYLLKNIKCKTSLVWDKKDKITPIRICKYLNKNVLNSNIILFKNGRHFTYMFNSYKFSNIIKEFVF